MELENEFTVPAPVSEVWKTLLDVQRIAPCMPGATLDRAEGDEVAGRVKVKVGPITASYAGTARFVTKDEAAHRLALEASGRETRGSGTASATVEAQMSEEESATRVRVRTSLNITGRQAQFGRGVLADVAGKLTDQFAACLAEQIREPGAGATAPNGHTSAEAPSQAPASGAAPAEEHPGHSRADTAEPQDAQALDLVSTVVQPMIKQFAPVLGGLVFGIILGLLMGHRRRVAIVVAPMPARSVPRTRAML